jgi:hypothetical protein
MKQLAQKENKIEVYYSKINTKNVFEHRFFYVKSFLKAIASFAGPPYGN